MLTNKISFLAKSKQQSAIFQGSVLRPVLFLLYTADVLAIPHRHGIGAHSYADDTQPYHHDPADLCIASASAMVSCIGELDKWMCSSRLKLNADKMDFILQIEKANFHSVQLGGIDVHLSTTITCLGVLIDSERTLSAHIKRLTGRCFYQLRQLRTVRRALSIEAGRMLVHAFVISLVDYSNSIFRSTSTVHLHPLQCVLNAAARMIVKRRKFNRITDSLRDELHRLPVQHRYAFSSTNVCIELPHRTSSSNVYRLRTCGQPCSAQSMVCFQPRSDVSANKPGTLW